jgi:hypothetical protein
VPQIGDRWGGEVLSETGAPDDGIVLRGQRFDRGRATGSMSARGALAGFPRAPSFHGAVLPATEPLSEEPHRLPPATTPSAAAVGRHLVQRGGMTMRCFGSSRTWSSQPASHGAEARVKGKGDHAREHQPQARARFVAPISTVRPREIPTISSKTIRTRKPKAPPACATEQFFSGSANSAGGPATLPPLIETGHCSRGQSLRVSSAAVSSPPARSLRSRDLGTFAPGLREASWVPAWEEQ